MMIIEHNLRPQMGMKRQSDGSTGFGAAMMDFVTWFRNNEVGKRLVWVDYGVFRDFVLRSCSFSINFI